MNALEEHISRLVRESYEYDCRPAGRLEEAYEGHAFTLCYDVELCSVGVSGDGLPPFSEAEVERDLRRYRSRCLAQGEYRDFLYEEAYRY